MKEIVSKILAQFDIGVTRRSTLDLLMRNSNAATDLDFLKNIEDKNLLQYVELFEHSKAQLRQDLFVLSQLGFKENGFFVEFGATNGVELSNTYLLETKFGWNGILAEPAKGWHSDLKNNRKAHIDTRCVWKTSGEIIQFNESNVGELSTIDKYSSRDGHAARRKNGLIYDVKTVSLTDLLETHNAPRTIDYLSIDTEGSELEILKHFDYSKYDFKVITCEHNFTSIREKIHSLLTKNGYIRKYEKLSRFDDWYVKN